MTTGQRRRLPVAKFDPRPSAEFAATLLRDAGIPHALIGRVAVWSWLPTDQHGYTKDLDIAVPESSMPRLVRLLARRKVRTQPLRIGGLSVERRGVRVDFIDRRVDGFGPLFEEAVAVARKAGNVADIDGIKLPVVPPEYLIAMKMIPATDKDEEDVLRLLRARRSLDYAVARKLVRKHGGAMTANRLDELARRAGRPDAPRSYR